MPYFAFLGQRRGPRAPSEISITDFGNCQSFSLSRYACFTMPSFAKTRKRLEVIPKSLAALIAEIKISFSCAGN